MDGYLEHGKFKYIDKYKSKAGKWVYRYKQDAQKRAKSAFDTFGLGGNHSGGVHIKPKKQRTRYSFKDKSNASKIKRATTTLEKLNDKYGPKVTSSSTVSGFGRTSHEETTKNLIGGRVVSKRKYTTSVSDSNNEWTTDSNKRISERNLRIKNAASKAKRWLMDVNDKYGPKTVTTITSTSAYFNGKSTVYKIQKNLFGGRETFAYSYTVEENRLRKKSKPHKRASSSGGNKK